MKTGIILSSLIVLMVAILILHAKPWGTKPIMVEIPTKPLVSQTNPVVSPRVSEIIREFQKEQALDEIRKKMVKESPVDCGGTVTTKECIKFQTELAANQEIIDTLRQLREIGKVEIITSAVERLAWGKPLGIHNNYLVIDTAATQKEIQEFLNLIPIKK